MHGSEVLTGLIRKLEETGLADFPGRLLYSGIGTLSPSKLYMLGYNPGGDPEAENDTPKEHLLKLASRPPYWNEYVSGIWKPAGRVCAAGDAPMQRRVRYLISAIGLKVETVCASNVIFARSRVATHLENESLLAQRCWPVHQFILEHVRPKGILAIGGSPVLEFLCNKGRCLSREHFPSGHGNWMCQGARVQIGSQTITLAAVPHLARYAIDRHPDVIRWVRDRLKLQ